LSRRRDPPSADRDLAELQRLQREADAQALAILTPQQQARFQQMMGARFEKVNDEG